MYSSSIHIVAGAFEDLRRSFRDTRYLYVMLTLTYVLFGMAWTVAAIGSGQVGPIPEEYQPYSIVVVPLVWLSVLPIIPAIIGFIRYFVAGDARYGYRFGRPFWRFTGWYVLATFLLILAMVVAVVIGAILSDGEPMTFQFEFNTETMARPGAINSLIAIVVYALIVWIILRLYTFPTAFSLNEQPRSILGCFRETRGMAARILAWVYISNIVLLAVTLAYLICSGIMILFAHLADLIIFNQPDYRPIHSAVNSLSVLGLALLGIPLSGLKLALYGRIVRAIRAARNPEASRQGTAHQ